jgi:hypothetical protein
MLLLAQCTSLASRCCHASRLALHGSITATLTHIYILLTLLLHHQVTTLCLQTPNEIRTSARRLLPTLTNAALSERSGAVRGAYASALAGVSRLAPQALIAPLALKLCELFKAADPDLDSSRRAAAASLLKDLALRAGAAMGGVGSNVSAISFTSVILNTCALLLDNKVQRSRCCTCVGPVVLCCLAGGIYCQ